MFDGSSADVRLRCSSFRIWDLRKYLHENRTSIHESFCAACAGAVARFIVTGINEDVSFDSKAQRFVSKQVDDDIRPSDCEWWVGDDWKSFVGPLACVPDLAHPRFSEDALSKAIIFALTKSATGKRMGQILAGID